MIDIRDICIKSYIRAVYVNVMVNLSAHGYYVWIGSETKISGGAGIPLITLVMSMLRV